MPDTPEKLSELTADLREQIARVIDPDAWVIGDAHPDRPRLRAFCRDRSLRKADTIFALVNRRAETAEARLKRAEVAAFKYECIRWRGRELTGDHAHYCEDYDGLPVDETTPEWPCGCFPGGTDAADR